MARTIIDPRQKPLFVPESSWRPREDVIPLRGHKRVSIDLETRDPGLAAKKGSSWAWRGDDKGYTLGVSVAVDGWSRYYPLRHPEDNVEDPDRIMRWLRDELKHYDGTIVGTALEYDLGWLRGDGVDTPLASYHDIQIAEALLDEDRDSYSLNSICSSYGLPPKDERLLNEAALVYGFPKKVKENLWRLPGRFAGAYGERDTTAPLEVMDKQLPLLAEQKLERCHHVEQRLVRVNLLMREQGVPINVERAHETKKLLQAKEAEALAEIHGLSGVDVEVWSAPSVAKAFLAVGVDFPTTALHAPSFTQEWLDASPHPLSHAVRAARKYNRAWSTFIDGMIFHHLDSRGHLHPHWHSTKSDEGGTIARYSCTEPNLQQVPARDEEIGPLIRSLFVPEPGGVWFTSDISQQEPRFTLHFAALMKLKGAAEAAEAIRANPRLDYHQMVADITGLPRKHAKEINLGKAYGMGGAKLCDKLKLPTELWEPQPGIFIRVAGREGRAVINQYDERFPYVKALSEMMMEAAEKRGYIKTYLGRRSRFDLWVPAARDFHYYKGLPLNTAMREYGEDLKRAYTHKALNRAVQGSSADMIKLAVLRIYDEMGRVPLLMVHDEVDDSVSTEAEARIEDQCVRESVELCVPTVTDVELGPNWGETRKVKL